MKKVKSKSKSWLWIDLTWPYDLRCNLRLFIVMYRVTENKLTHWLCSRSNTCQNDENLLAKYSVKHKINYSRKHVGQWCHEKTHDKHKLSNDMSFGYLSIISIKKHFVKDPRAYSRYLRHDVELVQGHDGTSKRRLAFTPTLASNLPQLINEHHVGDKHAQTRQYSSH
jgi:hypothetical protein